MASISFGAANAEFQVGANYGTIRTHFRDENKPEAAPSPFSMIPSSRDPGFVADEDIFDQIRKLSTPGSRIALVGLGGIGKTQFAIEYCYRVREQSPDVWVFWIHASNAARFEQSYRDLAEHAKIPRRADPDANIFQLVNDWINDKKEKWILVLDNVDEDDFLYTLSRTNQDDNVVDEFSVAKKPLRAYIPRSDYGSIIMTTRDRRVALRNTETYNIIQIGQMKQSAAHALLKSMLGSKIEEEDAIMLAQELGYHPLAITQAASYIRHRSPRMSISQYLEGFGKSERRRTRLHSYEAASLHRDWEGRKSVLTTWQVTFDYLQLIAPSAVNLLSLMSFFDPDGFTENLLRIQPEENQDNNGNGKGSDSDDHDTGHNDFEDNLLLLRDYSLVSIHASGKMFTMHRLVQFSVKNWLKNQGRTEIWKAIFIDNLCREFSPEDIDSWEKWQSLFPHVKVAMSERPSNESSRLKWATLLQKGALYASMIGSTADMRQMAEQAFEARKDLLGSDDLETMDSMMMIIRAHILESQWNKAEELAKRMESGYRQILGEEHPAILKATTYLALVYWYQGRWREAELLTLKVLKIQERILGEEHLDTVRSRSNLALTYWNQGRWQEAEFLHSRVLEIRRRALGPNHPDTLTSMNNLATTYWNQGRWHDAEILGKDVYDTRIRLLGREHADTLTSMNNLASVYRNQGRLAEAESLSVQVLEAYQHLKGREHQNTLGSMENLASDYRNQGRWNEAEALQEQVLKYREKVLGLDHPDTLKSMANLTAVYRTQGRWGEAEALQVRVLEKSQRILGPKHPDVLICQSDLALVYKGQGRLDEAVEILLQVRESQQIQFGGKHPDTLRTMGNLASIFFNQGRWKDAEYLFTETLKICEEVLGRDHPSVLSNMHALALNHRSQGKLNDAEETQLMVMHARQRTLGPEHPDTLSSMEGLALLFFDKGQWKEAESLERKVKQTRIKIFGERHPDTTKAIDLLGKFSRKGTLNRTSDCEGSDSDLSDSGSVITTFSLAGSSSSNSSLDQPIFISGVEILSASLLKNARFQELCKAALMEKQIPRAKVHRNLGKLLRHFASHLGREKQAKDHINVIQFVRGASFRIASRIMQSPEIVGPFGLEELKLGQLRQETSKARIDEYFKSHGNQAELAFNQKASEERSNGPRGIEQAESDSDEDSSLDGLDEQEAQDQTMGDNLQIVEDFLFRTNAFPIMEREFFDFVFPSFRSIMMRWISKERGSGNFTQKQLVNLEAIVSELQHVTPDQISLNLQDEPSTINNIKGRWERFTGETWDWWPLVPYMRPLTRGEARLHWKCICGKSRWAEVPLSFAKTVTGASGKNLAPSYISRGRQNQIAPHSQPPNTAALGNSGQGPAKQSHIPGQVPTHMSMSPNLQAESWEIENPDLHLFLVTLHSSLLRSSYYRLAQTTTRSMSDRTFFAWVRATYHRHRGFVSTCFSVYRYSHCEFFKFERFSQDAYTPLCPEYPDTQQSSYHFSPRPIHPEPPVHPHRFEHWFESYTWYYTILRRIANRFSTTAAWDEPFDDVFVTQRLPKRDRALEERDPSHEIFWGLYIIEKRSTLMLLLWSFASLVPSFYFFFAWLFEWGHHGDLQNASVPLSLSIGLFATFWLCISFSAPSFESRRNIH